MSKITRIDINLPMHGEWYEVGGGIASSPHGNGADDKRIITEILEDSITSDENHVYSLIKIYTDQGLAKEIINTPMTITYGDGS